MRPARSGLVLLAAVGLGGAAHADTLVTSLSAPVFPQVLTLYAAEGANLPDTPEGRAALVDAAALTFPYLLEFCSGLDGEYAITQSPESTSDIAVNYSEIARCAYEKFTAKPYWIPQLVDEVDICGRTLGEEWHLLSEADVAGFSEADFAFIQATLAGVGGESNWGNFYFSLHTYVRSADGTLARADLSPGVEGPRITSLAAAPGTEAWARHLESDLSLRCIRTEVVQNAFVQ